MARSIYISKEMKICFVTTAFPRWENDYHSPFLLEEARAIHHEGIDVKVLAMHNPMAKKEEWIDGIQIIRPPYLPNRYEILRKDSAGLPSLWKNQSPGVLALIPFVIIHTLATIKLSKDCNLIHAHWTLSGMTSKLGQFIHRKPYVVTIHGSDIFQAGRIRFIAHLTRKSLNQSSGVIAVSKALKEGAIKMGVKSKLVEVIPNGVDTAKYYPHHGKRKKIILFVGAITENKGIRYLLEAFYYVLQNHPDFRLVLIGEGSEVHIFKTIAKSLNIENNVDFMGGLPPENVRNWMRKSKIFVLPSLSEGFGVVLLEALASGTPCVGTNTGGIPDILNNKIGRLVNPKDAFQLARGIIDLIENENYVEISNCARKEMIEKYNWPIIAKEIVKFYNTVIS